LKESGLKGRGGAGFPTGMKWEIFSKYKGKKIMLLEMGMKGKPGTF
jgi:NADH:ubiquinone oxidoreductase, NADH-binding (51 kD) subunit